MATAHARYNASSQLQRLAIAAMPTKQCIAGTGSLCRRANPRHTAPPQARQVAPAPPPTQNEATAPNQMGAAELARQEPAQGAVDVPDHSGRGSEPLWGSRRREDPGALVQPPRRKRMRAEAAVRTTIDAGGGPVAPAPDSVRAIVPENTAPPSLEALLRAGRPASGLPSVGDALAYRVLEIGNDLTPVLSDHRVGVVTTVDEASGRVVLAPQPSGIGAPPLLEEGDEEEAEETGGAEEGEEEEEWEVRPRMEAASIYDEDGTLDIAFGDLSEVLVLPGDALGGTGGDALPVREEGGEEEEGIPGGRSAAVRVSVGVGATACRHTAEGGEEGLVGEVVGVGGGAEGGLEGDVTARARRLSGIKALMR